MTKYYSYQDGQITDRNGTVLTLYDAELKLDAFHKLPDCYKFDGLQELTSQLAKAIEAFKRDMVTS